MAEEALADPYFAALHAPSREPCSPPVCKAAFEFERRKLGTDEVRELTYVGVPEHTHRDTQTHTHNTHNTHPPTPTHTHTHTHTQTHTKLSCNPGA